MNRSRHLLLALVATVALVAAACGDDDVVDGAATTTTSEVADASTTTAAPEPLTILVTNDDGIGSAGIDAVVTALSAMDDVELVIVAPAENQSGSSDTTTPEGVPSAPGATASGVEGTAVSGFPADSVLVALDELGVDPDLVVSGVNQGQNVGPLAAISGTVGAARTAIRRGVPAVAASAGLSEDTDFEAGAALVVAWITEHRAAIADGSIGADAVVSFNVPECTAGEIGDLVAVPLASEIPEGVNPFETDCSVDPADVGPVDDVDAISQGYATETLVPAEL
ncbi:5'/3'-nucleotidase SurE [Actinospongicola halichondriae]|uniref:5'/3'-nucleotidase SurE n=1 Tax=Actinospongicola halichondriae TaxID=3236844 RepID=UPI003D55ADCE